MPLPKRLKYAAISGGAALFGLVFGFIMFPLILKHQLKKEMALSKKTDVRKMWETIPFALHFKVYFFNYTNFEEVQNGGIPIVEEIGPYHFDYWKDKVEIEDHEEDDTVTYKNHDLFLFNKELSGPGLTGEEIIVIPHALIMGTIISIARDNPSMISMIGKALTGIFDKPTDVFMRVKPLDILFRGFMVNCSRTEFAPKAVCNGWKKEHVGVWLPGNQINFSFFGKRNNTVDPRVISVKRGIKNVKNVGKLLTIDGSPEMTIWRDTCNQYQGTDGTVFPPFFTKRDRIESFRFDLCRPFKPWYLNKTSYNGISTYRYVVNIGDLANDPELNCLCDAPDKCPPKGMMDLTNCVQAPIYATLPHFYDCDPSLLNNVKGLNPNMDDHLMMIDLEPISGTTMLVRQRIQFNLQLLKTEKYHLCKNLNNKIVPLFWIEEGLALNKTFVKMLNNQLFIPKKAVGVFRLLLLVFGSIGAIVGVVKHLKATSREKNKVTSVKTEEEEQKDISVIGQGQEPAKVNM